MPAPCNFDHNGECLVCDAWPSDCAWTKMMNQDFTYRSARDLIEMFYPYMSPEERIKYSLDMGKIFTPFTDEQVEKLKQWQSGETTFPTKIGPVTVDMPPHAFTCSSHGNCERDKREDEGILIPSNEGWICPCGQYKQNWCHDFMVK